MTDKSSVDIQTLILQELRDFRKTVTDWNTDHTARIASLETQVKSGVTGNGSPSRLSVAESKIDKLIAFRYWIAGACAAISAGLSFIVAFLMRK